MQIFLEVPCAVALEDIPVVLLRKMPTPVLRRISSVSLLPPVSYLPPSGHLHDIRLASIIMSTEAEPRRHYRLHGDFGLIMGYISVSNHIAEAIDLPALLRQVQHSGACKRQAKFPGRNMVDRGTVTSFTVTLEHVGPRCAASISQFNNVGQLALRAIRDDDIEDGYDDLDCQVMFKPAVALATLADSNDFESVVVVCLPELTPRQEGI